MYIVQSRAWHVIITQRIPIICWLNELINVRKKGCLLFSMCFCSTVLWLPPLQWKLCLVGADKPGYWLRNMTVAVGRNSQHLLWAAGLAPLGGGEGERHWHTKSRVHKAWHIPKFRPGNAGNEIQDESLLLCTVGRTGLGFATRAQPKPLRGQLEVMRTEIQHNQRGSFIHSLMQQNAS